MATAPKKRRPETDELDPMDRPEPAEGATTSRGERVRIVSERAILPTRKNGEIDTRRVVERLEEIEAYEETVQSIWRQEALTDSQYYDNQQFTAEEIQEMRSRGQAPVVYNLLKPRIDWMTGTERRARTDFRVHPRQQGEEASANARVKTDILKYLYDVNRAGLHRSAAFKEACISGLSWIETGIRADPEEEPLYIRQEHWWNVLHDSTWREPDGSDMRYLFRSRHIDIDIAEAYFPESKSALYRAAESHHDQTRSDSYYLGRRLDEWEEIDFSALSNFRTLGTHWRWGNSPRDAVRIRETWIFFPTRQEGVTAGGSTFDRIRMQLYLALWCDNHLLHFGKSPYRHNRIPFTPVVCYRRVIDGAPYGMIRPFRDPQDAFNKRMAKSIFAVSSTRLEVERGAVDETLMSEHRIRQEIARPDAFIHWGAGALSQGKVRITDGREVASTHIALANVDREHISTSMGVNADNLGNPTNAVSGVAIERRQVEGSLTTTEPFDNAHLAWAEVGRLALALVEQYYQAPKVVRLVTNHLDGIRWAQANTLNPETGEIENDLTRFEADFIIDQQQYQASMAHAAMAELWDLLQKVGSVDPELVRAMVDVVVQYSPVPGRELIVKRIRQITGMRDPDVPETEEERAEREAQEAAEAQQQQIAAERLMAEIAELEARARKTGNQAVVEAMKAIKTAIEAAQAAAMAPSLAPAADEMLTASGFLDEGAPGVVQGAGPMPPANAAPGAMPPPQPVPPGPPAQQDIMPPIDPAQLAGPPLE